MLGVGIGIERTEIVRVHRKVRKIADFIVASDRMELRGRKINEGKSKQRWSGSLICFGSSGFHIERDLTMS